MTRTQRLLLTAAAALTLALLQAGAAAAATPWWHIDTSAAPSYLPTSGEGQITLTATNLGDAETNGTITLRDELPANVKATSVLVGNGNGNPGSCEALPNVQCSFTKPVLPYETVRLRVTVQTEGLTEGQLANTATVTGGGADAAHITKALQVADQETPFGVESYEMTPENERGERDQQAAGHPFQLTTSLDLDTTLAPYSAATEKGIFPTAPALPHDLHFKLPVGLVGDVNAVPQCSETDFSAIAEEGTNECPEDTAIGAATVTINDPVPLGYVTLTVPVFNLRPEKGEPARFGFEAQYVPVVLKTAVPTGGNYAVEVSVTEASQAAQVLSSQVTLWGSPGAESHDHSRGWQCLIGGKWVEKAEPAQPCALSHQASPTAFITLPGQCTSPPSTTVTGDSWPAGTGRPGTTIAATEHTTYTFPGALSGCAAIPFNPTISLEPETTEANTPTGLNVEIKVPQAPTLDSTAPAGEGDLQEATVTLPDGLELNPSAANGLQVCSALQFGFEEHPETSQTQNLQFAPTPPSCPDASKVGTVMIETPLLEGQLITGSVYLAEQNTNPFQAPLVLYLTAEDPTAGILVKLAGSVTPTADGQVITTFQNTPQLPFSDLKLHLFGTERPPLSTPPKCGTYNATTSFTAWSGTNRSPTSSPAFQITSGQAGSPCQPTLPFTPSLTAGAQNNQAAALTPFTVNVGHADSDQPLERIELQLPPGIAALIAAVTPCPEAAALADSCPATSLIGHTTAVAGLGNEPVTITGQVYLTGALRATAGHGAAPFGLLTLTHAAAGPFDLGEVPVLATINVDPTTAAVSVLSEPIPKLIKGVPVDLKALQVTVERPGNQPFEFNPTNCQPLSVTGQLTGYEGAAQPIKYPFQVHGCASLPFHPALEAATQAQASRLNGASLSVKVRSAGLGQANIAKVALQLPRQLPSRLTTIQKACPDTTFEANPAGCDEGSVIGTATIHTPILNSPLAGPAYLVSHGGAAFPDVEFVLQGEGIKLILDGKTDIKAGVTYSRFEATPDAPFTSFETTLPAGPHSALGANLPAAQNENFCGTTLTMPTIITGQNGAVINQNTKIAIAGCHGVADYKKRLTPAQKLKRSLAMCRKRYKHSKSRRRHCETAARKAYRASKTARAHHRTRAADKPHKP